jgi:hypothetical protein
LSSKLEQEELKLKQEVLDKQNIEKEKRDLLIQMEKEKERLKQETLVKQNIENQRQELLIQMEEQKIIKSGFKISI